MRVLVFFTTFVCNISHSKKNSNRYYQECTNKQGFMLLFLSDLTSRNLVDSTLVTFEVWYFAREDFVSPFHHTSTLPQKQYNLKL
jgi:hypothetical protein